MTRYPFIVTNGQKAILEVPPEGDRCLRTEVARHRHLLAGPAGRLLFDGCTVYLFEVPESVLEEASAALEIITRVYSADGEETFRKWLEIAPSVCIEITRGSTEILSRGPGGQR